MAFAWGIWVLISTGVTFAYGAIVLSRLVARGT